MDRNASGDCGDDDHDVLIVAIKGAAGTVKVTGLKEMRATLKKLEDKTLLKEMGEVHRQIGNLVISEARSLANTKQENATASRLKSSSSTTGARVTLGGKPYDMGAEFGSYHNLRRILKETGGRATRVRKGEDINKVIARVEDQTVEQRFTEDGRLVNWQTIEKKTRKVGGVQVKVRGVMMGWNQFPLFRPSASGKGSKGQVLFPAIRAKSEEIADLYGKKINDIWGRK